MVQSGVRVPTRAARSLIQSSWKGASLSVAVVAFILLAHTARERTHAHADALQNYHLTFPR